MSVIEAKRIIVIYIPDATLRNLLYSVVEGVYIEGQSDMLKVCAEKIKSAKTTIQPEQPR